jgi:hypothetical protein
MLTPVATQAVRLLAFTVRSGGQTIVGLSQSLTVTLKEQLAVRPAASLTVQVTVVVPGRNVEPDAGLHIGAPTPGQLSLATGAGQLTTALHRPGSLHCVISGGQTMTGFMVSATVTVVEQLPLREPSLTEKLTVCDPGA